MLAPMLRSRSARRSRALWLPGVVLALVLAACGSSSTTTSSSVAANASARVATSASATGTAGLPAGCHEVAAPPPKGPQHLEAPTTRLDPAKSYAVKLVTNCGEIDIALSVKQAPKTTSSFAYLVSRGFYTDLTFHRIVPDFVIQGGDPLGTGLGGPGYTVVEAPPSNLSYTVGTVAMAKTSTQPSGASGSQFFIVSGPQASTLPPQYALVGHVTSGQSVVNAIQQVPTNADGSGMPLSPVVIRSATLVVG